MSIAGQRDLNRITTLTTEVVNKYWNVCELKLFKNGENVTFVAKLNNNKVYVRATENSRRSKNQIQAELKWVKSISETGLVVAHPIEDKDKNLLHTVTTEADDYHVAVFTNAQGNEPAKSSLDKLYIAKQLGYTIGRLHHYSSPNYAEYSGRHKWCDNIHVIEAKKIINEVHPPFMKEWTKCFNWWNELVKDNNLSLVHMDAHSRNFNIDKSGTVCLFDFDDCAWNFLSYDLAVAINGLLRLTEDKSEEEKIKNSFIKSYRKEYSIEQIWIDRIASFQRLREIEMFAWSMRMYGVKEDKKQSEMEHYQKLFESAAELI